MKVQDLAPTVTPFTEYKSFKASSWSSTDDYEWMDGVQICVRQIFHYDTLMAEFHSAWDAEAKEWDAWTTKVVSTGWGSVSDQKGMNQLLTAVGSAMRYSRKGGQGNYVAPNGNIIELPRY
jgi:hypothetical protein